ncbi:DUF3761 domain-containing protein [Methylobacterium tarhaniae]|uniref:DUF3761 domain-containing protein n=1 Tax=Methylobacterium tarhaniae TaxID=1187852 RepID=UPI001ABF48F3|nr:DUF3761 domain-containing protein [Methylobacterium tarhaniae]
MITRPTEHHRVGPENWSRPPRHHQATSHDRLDCGAGALAITATAYEYWEPAEGELTSHHPCTNVDGQAANTRDGHGVEGATARCGDGSWSFSRHHRGTCSEHQEVAAWTR